MTIIDLSGIDGLSESAIVTINERAQTAIDAAVKNRVEAEVAVKAKAKAQELAQAEIEAAKTDFKQKMDAMNAKLAEAQKASEDQQGAKDNPRIVELESALTNLKKELEQRENALQEAQTQLSDYKTTRDISDAIQRYNTINPTAPVHGDLMPFLVDTAKKRAKDVDGRLVPHNPDGSPVITNDGFSPLESWIGTHLRKEYPSFFAQTHGSGAAGSRASGSASKKFSDMSESERVELYKTDPQAYEKAKAAG